MRYRCQHCGRSTDGDGDRTTDNLVSQSVCLACAGMPRASWVANSDRRRRDENDAVVRAGENGSFEPGTAFGMAAWRAARSAGATSAEAARAAAEARPQPRASARARAVTTATAGTPPWWPPVRLGLDEPT